MFDLTIEFGDRPDGLATMGEALGAAGISVEGGALFTVDGKATGHYLVADGVAARRAIEAAGLTVTACQEVLLRRLRQEVPGELGAISRVLAEAGVRVQVQYSDHDHRLVLLTSDQGVAASATKAWAE